MNSLFVFLCVSVVLLGTSVQSRSLQQFAYKRQNEKNPLCEFIVLIMNDVVKNADLNLTPAQKQLLPKEHFSTRDAAPMCEKEEAEWMKAMTPFLVSLNEEQQGKLIAAFNKVAVAGEKTQRAISFAQEMLKRAATNQRQYYNDDDE